MLCIRKRTVVLMAVLATAIPCAAQGDLISVSSFQAEINAGVGTWNSNGGLDWASLYENSSGPGNLAFTDSFTSDSPSVSLTQTSYCTPNGCVLQGSMQGNSSQDCALLMGSQVAVQFKVSQLASVTLNSYLLWDSNLPPAASTNTGWHLFILWDAGGSTDLGYFLNDASGGHQSLLPSGVVLSPLNNGIYEIDAGCNGMVGDDGSAMSRAMFDVVMSLTPVPEPSTITLLLAGAIGLLAYVWRR
jgi:hypothetical protein